MPDETDRYPVNPLDGSANVADVLRRLERRVAELEGQRFVGSSLVMKDDNGDIRARIGRLIAAGGSGDAWGVEVVVQPGLAGWPGGSPFFRTTEDGAEFPYVNTAWVNETAISVTSPTFVDVYTTGIGVVLHKKIAAAVRVLTPVGTTGEIRLSDMGAGTQSPPVTIPSNTNAFVLIPAWAHGTPLWTGPGAFALQAKRTGGGGSVDVYQTRYGLTYQAA